MPHESDVTDNAPKCADCEEYEQAFVVMAISTGISSIIGVIVGAIAGVIIGKKLFEK